MECLILHWVFKYWDLHSVILRTPTSIGKQDLAGFLYSSSVACEYITESFFGKSF